MSWLTLPIRRDVDVRGIRRRMKLLADAMPLRPVECTRLMTAASELARWCAGSSAGVVSFGWNDVNGAPWVEFASPDPLPTEIDDLLVRLGSSDIAIERHQLADGHHFVLLRVGANLTAQTEPETLRLLLLRGDDATAVEDLRELNRQMAALLVELRAREEVLALTLEQARRAANEAAESALRLQELGRRKDEVLAIVSHDIRSPLAAARGALSMLEASLPTIDPDQRRLIDIAKRAGDNIVDLVGNVLTSALLDAGGSAYEPAPVDVARVTSEVVGTLDIPATQKSLRLSAEVSGPALALADSTWVRQVVSNLVMNAIKFTERGGFVTVRVARDDARHVRLEVADTGVGIPAGQREQVFQKLRKLRAGGTAGERGTGLGLYITKKLVDRMGGTIDFDSVEGKGTTFRVLLPAPLGDRSSMVPSPTAGGVATSSSAGDGA
jgi:signal transduction histidine kinase